MTSTVASVLSALVVLSLGCTKASSTSDQGVAPQPKPQPQPQPQPAGDVEVQIAAITLGEECGANYAPVPPPPAPLPRKRAPASVVPASPPVNGPSVVAEPSRYRCQATSVQLALHATALPGPTAVAIKKVELLDETGKLLGELPPGNPMRWSEAGAYEPWNERIAPNEDASVSYLLASPRWDAMEGGSWAQRTKMFQVRVTVAIGTKDKVLEKKAIQPTMMPPPVPT